MTKHYTIQQMHAEAPSLLRIQIKPMVYILSSQLQTN